MGNLATILFCLGAAVWACVCGLTIIFLPPSFSLSNMLMMMPPWCELEALNNVSELKLDHMTSVMLCIAALAIFWLSLYFNLSDDVGKMTKEAQQSKEDFKTAQEKIEKTRDILIDNAKLLLDNVDVEYQHCAATIAANNETPGQLVGGEVEWATGETSSEDEDATREVKGACLRKKSDNDLEAKEDDTKIFIQEKAVKIKEVHSDVEEPNVKTLIIGTEGQNHEGNNR